MTTIKHENQIARIYNEKGAQAIGSNAPNLEGLNPRELLEASIALCTTITARKVLERDGIPFDVNQIQATVCASKGESITNRFIHFDVILTVPEGLDAKYTKKLLASVERGCTISNTVKAKTTVSLTEKSIKSSRVEN